MKPYYEDDQGVTLYHGDNRDVLKTLDDSSIDSIVTDPPYELGFMGRAWDSSGIAYDVDLWRECFRVLKPGGHLLSFGASRTFHRMAVAVEDAGFELRDSIAWLYGSGFPKSMDVAKAIDKLDASDERLKRAFTFQTWLRQHLTPQQVNEATGTDMGHHLTTHPTQPSVATAVIFDALRPLLPEVPEEIERLVAERTVESQNFKARAVVGTARMVDTKESRLGFAGKGYGGTGATRDVDLTVAHTDEAKKWEGWGTALKPAFEPIVVGRKPITGTVAANVLRHGTGAINIDGARIASAEASDAGRFPANVLLDESQADSLDRQTGVLTSGANPTKRGSDKFRTAYGDFKGQVDIEPARGADSGGASRFFPTFRYEAKAPGVERPDVDGVQHATVKPLDLMRWLVRLVTPPGGTVLEPFAGSGTTIEAALLEGFRCIAVEIEADHMPLIMQRVKKPLQQSLFGDWDGAA